MSLVRGEIETNVESCAHGFEKFHVDFGCFIRHLRHHAYNLLFWLLLEIWMEGNESFGDFIILNQVINIFNELRCFFLLKTWYEWKVQINFLSIFLRYIFENVNENGVFTIRIYLWHIFILFLIWLKKFWNFWNFIS